MFLYSIYLGIYIALSIYKYRKAIADLTYTANLSRQKLIMMTRKISYDGSNWDPSWAKAWSYHTERVALKGLCCWIEYSKEFQKWQSSHSSLLSLYITLCMRDQMTLLIASLP